ncbi:MAG: M28 family peptidase, partial [Opitutaceae bacterium]|nr:M28 family peptidase [Opitutaceae bacterium]
MRRFVSCALAFSVTLAAARAQAPANPEATLRAIFTEALARGQAYGELRTLVTDHPGRLAGSQALVGAVTWAEGALRRAGADRITRQDVMVPHWERGAKESVTLLAGGAPQPLAAFALGGSVATPDGGLEAAVIEVNSLEEIATLPREAVAGKIVFFNRHMDPAIVRPGTAYSTAVAVRSRGPSAAARLGAVGVLVRSMTHALDDFPHTGSTTYAPDAPRIPAAAISTLAAERLSAALAAAKSSGATAVRVAMKIHSRWLPDAPSHNVLGEIRGTEFPDHIILVGGHLDSWDVSPGAHDNGAGVVQSIEVLRIFRALGL